ncbi:MAG: pyridoxal phosphate-dependent aminotransferase [Candidatus Omnitrophota bacterium]|nr:MAG: pyridoxal phosphate-dependent aminotransferase [Candidatus Omnitrophota bacterium]
MKSLSQRANGVTPSPTLAISAKAKEMKKQGVDVIIFGAGEPDFDTPKFVKQAAISAINEGFTKYTPASGTKELKEAVVAKLQRDNKLDYSANQIIISCGAKHSLYNCFQAICNPGDEVIIFSPYWVSYPEMIKLAGAVPVVVTTKEQDGFRPSLSSVTSAISQKTKAIIINSPCNPTGSVYPEELLRQIGEAAVKNDLWIISDEVYEKIIFDSKEYISIAALGEDIKSHTIVVNAVSKTYAMTGWRIGYLAGPAEAIKAMGNIQSHSTSNPNSIAQRAALTALGGNQEEVSKMVVEFEKRRNFIVEKLKEFEKVSFHKPEGAFYLFLNIGSFLKQDSKGVKKINNSVDFANYLLQEAKVAVVPGSAFGADDYIRMSFATSIQDLSKGLDRIETALFRVGVF